MKEKDIIHKIKLYLRERGIECFKHHGGPYSHIGVSDIIGVLPTGRALFIECKTPDGRLSEPQKLFLERMRKSNAAAFVATCVEDVDKQIKLWINVKVS